jgi:hypothetical protein
MTSSFAHPFGIGPNGIGSPMLHGKFALPGLYCEVRSACGLISVVFKHGIPLNVPFGGSWARVTAAIAKINEYFILIS